MMLLPAESVSNNGVSSSIFKGEYVNCPYQGTIETQRKGDEIIIKADVWCKDQSKPLNKRMVHLSRIHSILNGSAQLNVDPQAPYTLADTMGISHAVFAKIFEEPSLLEKDGVQQVIDLNVCPTLLQKMKLRDPKRIQEVKADIPKSPKQIALETFNRESIKGKSSELDKLKQSAQKIDIEQVLDFVRNQADGLSLLVIKLAVTSKIKAIFGRMVNLQLRKNRWNITWNDPKEGAKNASVHTQIEEFSGRVREVLEANM